MSAMPVSPSAAAFDFRPSSHTPPQPSPTVPCTQQSSPGPLLLPQDLSSSHIRSVSHSTVSTGMDSVPRTPADLSGKAEVRVATGDSSPESPTRERAEEVMTARKIDSPEDEVDEDVTQDPDTTVSPIDDVDMSIEQRFQSYLYSEPSTRISAALLDGEVGIGLSLLQEFMGGGDEDSGSEYSRSSSVRLSMMGETEAEAEPTEDADADADGDRTQVLNIPPSLPSPHTFGPQPPNSQPEPEPTSPTTSIPSPSTSNDILTNPPTPPISHAPKPTATPLGLMYNRSQQQQSYNPPHPHSSSSSSSSPSPAQPSPTRRLCAQPSSNPGPLEMTITNGECYGCLSLRGSHGVCCDSDERRRYSERGERESRRQRC
ncbi:hypothetical protein K474DRAFT_1714150 [Panus rudis PR-1116 ss-1]|nr:hypothetical protein K474DRAFT_1714150 [Panus rudis PR-1116 ss-1]